MGKRLVCPACRSENVYDEPVAFMNVRCKACGRTFSAEANLFVTEVPAPAPPVRLTCSHCHIEHVYEQAPGTGDVRRGGAARCKSCGEIFNVPPPGDELGPSGAHGMKHDRSVAYAHARGRLRAHVDKYPDYLDRDRDLVLLHLADRLDELQAKLDRVIDALAEAE